MNEMAALVRQLVTGVPVQSGTQPKFSTAWRPSWIGTTS